jgi:release factor glutamine methyltransferase
MLDTLQKNYANFILKPFLKRYLKRERRYSYNGLTLKIAPGVFHPGYFFSTRVLVDFVSTLPLKGASFCEPACGSGIISLHAYKQGAHVTAFDINTDAVNKLKENFSSNFPDDSNDNFKVLVSDVFTNIPHESFEYVVINPPYFFKNASTLEEHAWYCGNNGEFFQKLFSQLPAYVNKASKIFMILADNCEIEKIKRLGEHHGFSMELHATFKVKWEKNYIFKIKLKA